MRSPYNSKKRPYPDWGKPPRVAVYGTLRRGGALNPALHGQNFIGQGKVSGADMYCLGGCPGIKLVPDKPDHKIVVEVFEVDRDLLTNHLDAIEAMYNRVEVTVDLDDGTTTKAWIYEIEDYFLHGSKLITSGDWNQWRKTYDPWEDNITRRTGIQIVSRSLRDDEDPEIILVDRNGFPVVEGESIHYKNGKPCNQYGNPVQLICIDDLEIIDEKADDVPKSIADMTDEDFERLHGNA